MGSGVGVGMDVGGAIAVGSGVGVGMGVGISAGWGVDVDPRAAVKVGVETSEGSVAGVFAGRSTAVFPVGADASDVAGASVATITVASTVGAVVDVEICSGVGWPPVQARAARAIMARNTSATGLIYQLHLPA